MCCAKEGRAFALGGHGRCGSGWWVGANCIGGCRSRSGESRGQALLLDSGEGISTTNPVLGRFLQQREEDETRRKENGNSSRNNCRELEIGRKQRDKRRHKPRPDQTRPARTMRLLQLKCPPRAHQPGAACVLIKKVEEKSLHAISPPVWLCCGFCGLPRTNHYPGCFFGLLGLAAAAATAASASSSSSSALFSCLANPNPAKRLLVSLFLPLPRISLLLSFPPSLLLFLFFSTLCTSFVFTLLPPVSLYQTTLTPTHPHALYCSVCCC